MENQLTKVKVALECSVITGAPECVKIIAGRKIIARIDRHAGLDAFNYVACAAYFHRDYKICNYINDNTEYHADSMWCNIEYEVRAY